MDAPRTTEVLQTIPPRRWYVKLARSAAGVAVLVVGVPLAHRYGWPWQAQAVVAVVGGLVFSTDFVKLGARTVAAAIRDVLSAVRDEPPPADG